MNNICFIWRQLLRKQVVWRRRIEAERRRAVVRQQADAVPRRARVCIDRPARRHRSQPVAQTVVDLMVQSNTT